MKKVLRKILPYIIYGVLIALEAYALFIYKVGKESQRLHMVLLIGFVLSVLIPVVTILVACIKKKSMHKLMLSFLILLVVVQVLSLPITNLYADGGVLRATPRGSIYQFPGLRNSVSLNELGLFMGYYLDGKTLYAMEGDDPKDFDNGYLFMSNQYTFVPMEGFIQNPEYNPVDNPNIYYMKVREDKKRKVPGFMLLVYTAMDHHSYDEVALLKDHDGNWHVGPKDILLEEAVTNHE